MDDVCLKHIELWFLTSRKEEQEETFEEVDHYNWEHFRCWTLKTIVEDKIYSKGKDKNFCYDVAANFLSIPAK